MSKSILESEFLLILKSLGISPVREYKFHPERRWKFDFALPDKKLAFEVEGGIWIHGRHSRGKGFMSDCEKYNSATKMGWKVLRYTREMFRNVKEDYADIARI